ncbi:MAG: hypothetical protein M0005_02110 [Actinomycetota bacterium]|nr:hypothetical protein [Actinomycetota bacterium]
MLVREYERSVPSGVTQVLEASSLTVRPRSAAPRLGLVASAITP